MSLKKYMLFPFMLMILLFNVVEVNAYGDNEEYLAINRMADEIYRRYNSDTIYFDSLILSSGKNQLNDSLNKAKRRLSVYCTDQIVERYLDCIKDNYGYKKNRRSGCKSDILIYSKIIYMDASNIIVYQKRMEKHAPSQYGGAIKKYETYKYVFLENNRNWKLKDIVDARNFLASM